MKLRTLIGVAFLFCMQRGLWGTSCAPMPPCASVWPGTILFVGIVIDPGVESGSGREPIQEARISVHEIFEGLPLETKETVVTTNGWRLERGAQYFFETGRGDNGSLYPTICGHSGEVTGPWVGDFLSFLRERAKGETVTSLAVNVTSAGQSAQTERV